MKGITNIRRLRVLFLSVLLIISVMLISACGSESTSGNNSAGNSGENYEFTYLSILPQSSEDEVGYWMTDGFAKEVEERSNGRIKFKMFYNSELSAPNELLDALASGTVDIINTAPHYYGDLVPEANLAALPFWASDSEQAFQLMNETEIGQVYDEAFLNYGAKHLGFTAGGGIGFMSNKPADSVEDLTKMVIRASGGFTNVFYEKLGITGASIPVMESYDALSRGVVDGNGGSFSQLDILKLGEVVENIIYPTYLEAQMTTVFMNSEKWANLPEDLKNIIQETIDEMVIKDQEILDRDEGKIDEFLEQYGVEKITLSEKEGEKLFQAGVETWEEFAKLNEGTAKIVDILKETHGVE